MCLSDPTVAHWLRPPGTVQGGGGGCYIFHNAGWGGEGGGYIFLDVGVECFFSSSFLSFFFFFLTYCECALCPDIQLGLSFIKYMFIRYLFMGTDLYVERCVNTCYQFTKFHRAQNFEKLMLTLPFLAKIK